MYSKSRGTEGNRNVVKILKFIDDMILSRYTEYVGDCTPIDMRFPRTREHWPSLVQCFFIIFSSKSKPGQSHQYRQVYIRRYLADMMFPCCVQRVP